MNDARRDNGGCIRSAGNGLGADKGFEVGRLACGVGDAKRLLEFLAVSCISEKEASSLSAFLLQSLQNENTAASIGQWQKRDGCIVLARAASEGQSVIGLLLTGPGMKILEEFWAFSNNALALLKIELVLEVGDPWVGAWAADEYKIA